MKKYTQQEFDGVPSYLGNRRHPTGDYSAVTKIGHCNVFGNDSVFGSNIKFGFRNKFGEQCVFGDNNIFGGSNRFGHGCVFGNRNMFPSGSNPFAN